MSKRDILGALSGSGIGPRNWPEFDFGRHPTVSGPFFGHRLVTAPDSSRLISKFPLFVDVRVCLFPAPVSTAHSEDSGAGAHPNRPVGVY